MKKIELLAPCGDFECFMAAINAGADAVYLGGDKFGARAYANNFSKEEIIEAIKIAHLFSRKVYLTVNTLVKETEISDLIPFMEPLVLAGLDGVIVQDIGVFFMLRENFSKLELHASTQMTITGIYGAKFLKEIGATRIVPARELSLQEIKDIKNETGLEIETFIHGAMCYAYSGQCLFSSILGGRSGNRGRCAGPCRLPYEVNGKNVYPLSLKDMYTLNNMPALIDAGIDSFKIEGRMKSPEYVAGVTSMYRKYIDMYLSKGIDSYKVSKEDENIIRNLYIRSDICEGYYNQHNNKNMVTIHEPGYKGCDQEVLNKIKQKYLDTKPSISINASAVIEAGKAAKLSLFYKDFVVEAEGEIVSEAMNRPLSRADICDKLSKTGNTCFKIEKFDCITDDKSFMPVKALNELRRIAIEKLENCILNQEKEDIIYKPLSINTNVDKEVLSEELFVAVSTMEQLYETVKSKYVKGIYVNSDLLLQDNTYKKIIELVSNNSEKDFFISLPSILRKRSYKYLSVYLNAVNSKAFKGILVKNLEEYEWLIEAGYKGQLISDYSIYSWNKRSIEVFSNFFTRTTLPVELNKKEIFDIRSKNREVVLYTRLPLMYSANCIQKTCNSCINDTSGRQNVFYIKDRHKNMIPILQNCYHCYNVLYNPVVMSFHNQLESIRKEKFDVYRLEFTLENASEAGQILRFYENILYRASKEEFPVKDYTAGHYKRGVE